MTARRIRARIAAAGRGGCSLWRGACGAALALFPPAPARAYETDQLTHRSRPLADAAPVADALADEVLATAIRHTNRRTGCRAGPDRTRRVLARQIYRHAARSRPIWSRGPFRMWGHGRYSALLETDTRVERFDFADRDDVFGGLSLRESVILHLAGPASTVQIAGVRVGTDKFDHFFQEGYRYFERSHWGAVPVLAVEWGTRTERTYFGTLTSRTFSFADLRANYDGYEFYAGLLREGSPIRRQDDGCVGQVRPWAWSAIVDWQYDEVLNPSVFAPIVQWGLQRRLDETRDQVCAEYRDWGGEPYRETLSRALHGTPSYLYGPYPTRGDPFQLDALCPVSDHDN